MSDSLEKTAAPWKTIANMWSTWFTPPSRVSKDEARKYKEWLIKYKDSKRTALILGVTPEIREPLAKLTYTVTCIDINKEMIQAMNSLLKVRNPKETIVNENWLTNSLPDNSFDIVLGDAVLPNVSWEDRETLLLQIKRVMKQKGLYITRAFCVPRKKPFKNINQLLDYFSNKQPNYTSALGFVFELQILTYTPNDHLGTFTKPKEILEKLRDKDDFRFENKNLNKLLNMVWDFWCTKFINKVFTYTYRDEEEEQYQKYFEIVETYESNDHPYSKVTPMYILKLR